MHIKLRFKNVKHIIFSSGRTTINTFLERERAQKYESYQREPIQKRGSTSVRIQIRETKYLLSQQVHNRLTTVEASCKRRLASM